MIKADLGYARSYVRCKFQRMNWTEVDQDR